MTNTRTYKEFCENTNKNEIISVEYILNSNYWIKGRIENCSNINCPYITKCNVYKNLDNQIPYGY